MNTYSRLTLSSPILKIHCCLTIACTILNTKVRSYHYLHTIVLPLLESDSGQIDFNELMAFAEQKGIGIYTQFVGYKQKPIHKLSDFLVALQDTLLLNVKRVFMAVSIPGEAGRGVLQLLYGNGYECFGVRKPTGPLVR